MVHGLQKQYSYIYIQKMTLCDENINDIHVQIVQCALYR